jgi:shikimate dehydrogenase
MRSFKQELVALFGQPVAENPTQAMVEAAFADQGLDWRYLTIEVAPESLADAVRGARAMGFRGFHCTIPHKVAVIPHLDRLGESAELIGAVNCVVARNGELVGENTDGKGLVMALRRKIDPAGTNAVLFGAGGAARALAIELALAGAARIVVVNRSEQRGRELVELVRERTRAESEYVAWRGDYAVSAGTDVVVNATSIGLFPDVEARVPIDAATLKAGMVAADVVPNPPRTRFLEEAEAAGCAALDGLELLVEQGALSVAYWTGAEPDPEVMRAALTEALAP